MQLQDSEPVTHDIITQIAHLAMLLIIHITSYCNIQQQLENIPSDAKAQRQSVWHAHSDSRKQAIFVL